jgi:hypothetical protein
MPSKSFHRTPSGRVQEITAKKQFESQNLKSFDPMTQELYWLLPATNHPQQHNTSESNHHRNSSSHTKAKLTNSLSVRWTNQSQAWKNGVSAPCRAEGLAADLLEKTDERENPRQGISYSAHPGHRRWESQAGKNLWGKRNFSVGKKGTSDRRAGGKILREQHGRKIHGKTKLLDGKENRTKQQNRCGNREPDRSGSACEQYTKRTKKGDREKQNQVSAESEIEQSGENIGS